MSQPMTDRQRRRLTWILFALLGAILLVGTFAPAYIAGVQRQQTLRVSCETAAGNIQQLMGTRQILTGQIAIAKDLGLPVVHDLRATLQSIQIPEVPPECVA